MSRPRGGLTLRVNEDKRSRILLEIDVDGELLWSIAIIDDRPDLEKDPTLVVYDERDEGEEPSFTSHAA